MPEQKSVAIVGSTGSIGTQSIQVIADDPENYRVTALAAGRSVDQLVSQALAIQPDLVAIGDEALLGQVRDALPSSIEVVGGTGGLIECAQRADVTINGVVGFAGLPVTLACLQAGKRLGLANKESLIAAGPVVQQARKTPGAELVPVDSEHAAIHQCLRANDVGKRVSKIQVTASGGPFRGMSSEDLARVTIEEALNHPTWSMGPKITIDSSTLMNKGLEVIEANELFGKPAGDSGFDLTLDDIEVVVHPQSVVHSMVTYSDGSTIAQLSMPDMRLPIAYALSFPDRFPVAYGAIDWTSLGRLDFEGPDRDSFPCLDLAYAAARTGGTAPAWLSAANEVAVEAFLKEKIRWVDIAEVNSAVLSMHDGGTGDTLAGVLEGDQLARRRAEEILQEQSFMRNS